MTPRGQTRREDRNQDSEGCQRKRFVVVVRQTRPLWSVSYHLNFPRQFISLGSRSWRKRWNHSRGKGGEERVPLRVCRGDGRPHHEGGGAWSKDWIQPKGDRKEG